MITNCNKSAITLPGENGRLHYTIRESSRGNVFDVDMTSGEIYPALPVDYEKARSHWIIVQASDSSFENPSDTNINVSVSQRTVTFVVMMSLSIFIELCSLRNTHVLRRQL